MSGLMSTCCDASYRTGRSDPLIAVRCGDVHLLLSGDSAIRANTLLAGNAPESSTIYLLQIWGSFRSHQRSLPLSPEAKARIIKLLFPLVLEWQEVRENEVAELVRLAA